MKRVTSSDIARLAGVSRSTVSRVINNYSNVPDETRERVQRVIRENHYYPQISGQMLCGMKKRTIGLFWISSHSIADDTLSSSYFMNIVDAATARDYLVLSCILPNLTDEKNIQYVRKVFMEGRIDAGVFVGVNSNEPLIADLANDGAVVGVFDYDHACAPVENCITANFGDGVGEQAIDYLYSMGHRKIALIDGDLNRLCCIQRHESALRSIRRHGLKINPHWLVYGGITQSSGYEGAKQMLANCGSDLPTAIFANNDAVAFGVYCACLEAGLRIPTDISIIGADGHAHGLSIQPPLTTFTFDFHDMFKSLVNRVIDVIEEADDVQSELFFPGTLTERSSCCRL